MDDGLVAAARWFPGRRHALEALAGANDTFRALCSDFAAAQEALQQWQASASPVREQRCSEYEELVESLAGEIHSYLDAAEIGSSYAR